MLGQPEPPVAQLLRVLRQPQRVPKGLRRRAVLKDGSEIENRQYQWTLPATVCKSLEAEVKNWKARWKAVG